MDFEEKITSSQMLEFNITVPASCPSFLEPLKIWEINLNLEIKSKYDYDLPILSNGTIIKEINTKVIEGLRFDASNHKTYFSLKNLVRLVEKFKEDKKEYLVPIYLENEAGIVIFQNLVVVITKSDVEDYEERKNLTA